MDMLKRKIRSDDTNVKGRKIEVCPHAEKCFRRNPHHFREYDHPHLNEFLSQGDAFTMPADFPQDKKVVFEQMEILKSLGKTSKNMSTKNKSVNSDIFASTSNQNNGTTMANKNKRVKTTCFVPNSEVKTITGGSVHTMKDRLGNAAPYNLFFTKVPEATRTLEQENAITFTDLLSPSLGELKTSLQINFMIDVMWLMEQYHAQGVSKKPMTILYGYEFPNMKEYMEKLLPHVTHHLVQMKDPFGTHHSKIGLYVYSDGSLRVVVSTANLYYEDWNHYNQGLWVSPTCPLLPADKPDTDGSGPTGFKNELLKYLQSYNLPCLKEFLNYVKRADFSDIRVFLVCSIPGKRYPKDTGCSIHRISDLLFRHCTLPPKTTPQSEGPLSWGIIAQASTIGSLGKSAAEWLRSVLLRTLATHKQGQSTSSSNASLSVVFPTIDNVMNSHFGADGGGCLPYSKAINEKQKWLKDYLHQWKADHSYRTRAMPHIKTYTRVSPCLTKLAWFFITSANISKAAWGGNIQKDSSVYVRSYEVGVLFLPSFFDEEYFTIKNNNPDEAKHLFPFIYDLPLTPYKRDDSPWCN